MKKFFNILCNYLCKKFIWITFLIFIFFLVLVYLSNKDQRLFVTLVDGKTKVEIPKDIVKQKDCKKYKEWLEKWATPMIIASDRCPWAKAPEGKIGKFEINGVKFYIPRDYLLFDKKEPDGETELVSLLMEYPNMTPAGYAKERNVFYVKVRIDGKDWCNKEKLCEDTGKTSYATATSIAWNKKNNISNIIKKLYELPKEDLAAYRINNSSEFLIRGNPLNPDYWMRCATEEAAGDSSVSCNTVFDYNDKIYIDYDFSRKYLLKDHDNLRAQIIAKINEFRIPTKDE
jgi:hypothetical protein